MIHKAEKLLHVLETTQATLHPDRVRECAAAIRREYESGGRVIDEALAGRIDKATARAHVNAAEGALDALAQGRPGYGILVELKPFPMSQNLIDQLADTIRGQFEAGGRTVDDALAARIASAKLEAGRISANLQREEDARAQEARRSRPLSRVLLGLKSFVDRRLGA